MSPSWRYTDNVLTGRAFAAHHGDRIDAKREMLALGTANLGAGLLHGFPVSSSGSRTAIVDAVGGRTQLTGLVTLLSTVVAVFTLRPVLEELPAAALGAVVVYAAVRLVDIGEFRRFAAFRRSEFLLALATTAGVLVGRRAVGHPAGDRPVRPRLAAAGEPDRTTQSRAGSPGWPACTT